MLSRATSTSLIANTVVSAAGPHWYRSCGKNGVPSSSTACAASGNSLTDGGIEAQPLVKTKRAGTSRLFWRTFLAPNIVPRLDTLEYIRHAHEFENQKHHEYNADNRKNV